MVGAAESARSRRKRGSRLACFSQTRAGVDPRKNRAARFHFARDREFFVAARGILRELAGAYLKKAPSELRFQYESEGKPSISPNNLDSPIRFNLSHSRETALYAFACGREVGIDVESFRTDLVGRL